MDQSRQPNPFVQYKRRVWCQITTVMPGPLLEIKVRASRAFLWNFPTTRSIPLMCDNNYNWLGGIDCRRSCALQNIISMCFY